ncbi:MAG TPA: hypothetical protein VMW41_06140 [Candidatus Bathyarchaeia archaeon]|nr:hypothetical protein [Candidatus Bathyarchaeia archaeon]
MWTCSKCGRVFEKAKQPHSCHKISIPCCIHLFGNYDFLAALPKKDKLEIRFALDQKLDSPRLKICVPMSAKVFKNCIDLKAIEEINEELIRWLSQAYHLKDKQ